MKPFDLEAALAGAKVVTREGSEVTQLTLFDIDKENDVLYGVLESEVNSWLTDGRYFKDTENNNDLFMAPNAKSIWVARFGDGQCVLHGFSTLEQCQSAHPDADGYHRIEWEE